MFSTFLGKNKDPMSGSLTLREGIGRNQWTVWQVNRNVCECEVILIYFSLLSEFLFPCTSKNTRTDAHFPAGSWGCGGNYHARTEKDSASACFHGSPLTCNSIISPTKRLPCWKRSQCQSKLGTLIVTFQRTDQLFGHQLQQDLIKAKGNR